MEKSVIRRVTEVTSRISCINNIRLIYNSKPFYFFIAVIMLLMSVPTHFIEFAEGLDPSWMDFLNYAHYKGAVWGENTFFTYGPLSFLEVTQNYGHNMAIALMFWLAVFGVHIFALSELLTDLEYTKRNKIIVVIAAVLYGFYTCGSREYMHQCSLYLVYVAFLCMGLIFRGKDQYILPFVLMTTSLFFLKFSSFITLFASLVAYTVFCFIVRTGRLQALLMWLSVPLSFAGYMIYNPRVSSYLRYLKGCWEISSGYCSAMSLDWTESDEAVFLVVLIVIICLILLVLLSLNQVRFLPLYAGIGASMLFYYKAGFVRHGITDCFQGIAAVFSVLMLFYRPEDGKRPHLDKYINSAVIGIIIICSVCTDSIFTDATVSLKNHAYRIPISMIKAINYRPDSLPTLSEDIKAVIGKESVCIFPWELSYGYDEDINISWMPVIQNYSSYTVWCDELNADYFYNSDTAPKYIVFSFDTIDKRFPLIETPRTWHAIRDCYEQVMEDDDYYLLVRKNGAEAREYDCEMIYAQTVTREESLAAMDEKDAYTVEIPRNAKYFSIEAKEGIRCKLERYFWKIDEINLVLLDAEGKITHGRVLPEVMNTIISLNEVGKFDDFEAAVADGPAREYRKMKLTGDGLQAYDSYTVTWYAEPDKKLSVNCLGEEPDFFRGYTLKENTNVLMSPDVYHVSDGSIYLSEGWVYADWNLAQEAVFVVDGKVYGMDRHDRADVIEHVATNLGTTLEEDLKPGVSGAIPEGHEIYVVVYDSEEKVYARAVLPVGVH